LGSNGQVTLWKHKLQEKKIAVKRYPYKNTDLSIVQYTDISYLEFIANEVKAHNYLKEQLAGAEEYHFIGQLKRYTYDDTYFYLIYDYYSWQVDDYIYSFLGHHAEEDGLFEKFAIIAQLAFAVKGLQRIGVAHNDLKPTNIMVDNKGCLKIIDFEFWEPNVTKNEGCMDCQFTKLYASPEKLSQSETGWNSDSWSIGTVAYELIFEERIFDKHQIEIPRGYDFKYMIKNSALDSIFLKDIMKYEMISSQVNEFSNLKELLGLFNKNSDERTTAEELYKSFNNAFEKRIKECSK